MNLTANKSQIELLTTYSQTSISYHDHLWVNNLKSITIIYEPESMNHLQSKQPKILQRSGNKLNFETCKSQQIWKQTKSQESKTSTTPE